MTEGAKIRLSGEGINELRSAMERLGASVKESLDQMSAAFGKLESDSAKLGTGLQRVQNESQKLGASGASSMRNLRSATESSLLSLTSLTRVISIVSASLSALSSIKIGMEYENSLFRMSETFKTRTSEMVANAKLMAERIKHYFDFTQIAYAFTKTSDSMQRYGIEGARYLQLVQRATDIAAAKTIDLRDAIDRVESAMRGEAEASEYLGLTLNDTYMKNKAFGGALRELWEKLEDNTKAWYRWHVVMEQSEKYSGAASRATDTLSGSLKSLWGTLKDQLGPEMQKIIGLMARFVNLLNATAQAPNLSDRIAITRRQIEDLQARRDSIRSSGSPLPGPNALEQKQAMDAQVRQQFDARLSSLQMELRDLIRAKQSLEMQTQSIGTDTAGGLPVPPGGNKLVDDKKEKKDSKSSVVAQWDEELQRLKDLQQNWETWSTQRELEFWQQKLALTKKGTDEWWGVWHKIAELQRGLTSEQKAELEKQAEEELRIMEVRSRSTQQYEQSMYDMRVAAVRARVQLGQISEKEGLRLEQEILDARYQAQLAALQNEAALMEQKPVKLAEVHARMLALTEKYRKDQQKAENQAAMESKRHWDGIASSISGAVNNMLFSTQTMMERVRSLLQSLAQHVIEVIIKKIVTGWIAGEAAKTGATAAGTAARTSVETAGASTGFVAKIAINLKTIMADAYKAAAGAYSAVVGIPIIGPILAPAAAAVAFAAVAAFGSGMPSAAGGWDVPADSLALIHSREMVLPAHLADRVRSMTEPGTAGGSGGQLHLHIQATDAKSFEQQLRRADSALNKQLKKSVREFRLRPGRPGHI